MTGESSAPRVSFVVPCYNYGRFLPDCLNSIFRQEGGYSFEIIAIDDASTDDTEQVLERFCDPRLRVLRHAVNQGHLQAMTDGLLAARGDLVARIDPDDRYRSLFLRETVPLFEQYPEVGLVHGGIEVIDGAGNPTGASVDHSLHGRTASKGNVYVELLGRNAVAAATVIARREMWLAALPLPSDLSFSDWYFNLMMARRCEFYFVPQVLADYRVHGANHHITISRNKTWETGVVSILDQLFSETEALPELETAKQSTRDRIYATHFWEFANQYFEYGFFADARRCYFKVLRYQPAKAVSALLWRRLLAILLGKRAYDVLKSLRGHRVPEQSI
jgi:glycosyltransferase involved in cell wall biosynthesis